MCIYYYSKPQKDEAMADPTVIEETLKEATERKLDDALRLFLPPITGCLGENKKIRTRCTCLSDALQEGREQTKQILLPVALEVHALVCRSQELKSRAKRQLDALEEKKLESDKK